MGQIRSSDDKAENLEQIRCVTTAAADAGAQLVVFPECAMFEGTVPQDYVAAAEPLDGPFVTELRAIAARSKVAVVAGITEEVAGEPRAFNTLYVAGPDGKHLAHYRKVHLYDAFSVRESDVIRPSDDVTPVVFRLAGMSVGLMTCYDLRFPEMARDLAVHGAELILAPSSWTPGARKEDHWSVLTRCRAIENTVFVLAVNQAPPLATGGSLLVDPMGVVIRELGEDPAFSIDDIGAERIAGVRAKLPSLANRRYSVTRTL